MAVRDDARNPLAAKGASMASLHLCVGPALVEENQPFNGNARQCFRVPMVPLVPDVRPIPFLGDGAFFFALCS